MSSLVIDEDHMMPLGSDHNYFIMAIKIPIKAPSAVNETHSNMQKWNIVNDTDWLLYQNCICGGLS